MKETWRDRLRALITERHLNMKQLSLLAGLGETAVRDMLERDQTPKISQFAKIANALGVSVGQLFDGDEHAVRMVPIVGAVSAGEGWGPIDDGDLGEVTFDAGPDPVALVVVGDSMLPRYEAGDLLIGRKRKGSEIATLYGRDCIVMTDRDERYVKILKPSTLRHHYTLCSHNPRYEDKLSVRLEWAAAIEWVRKIYKR